MTTLTQRRKGFGMAVAAMISMIALAAQAADVSTVDGKTVTGNVVALDAETLTIEVGGVSKSVPLESVLQVRLPESDEPSEGNDGAIRLDLHHGGHLSCRQIVMEDRTVVADSVVAGRLRVPLSAVVAIRFRPAEQSVDEHWAELIQSSPDRDLLIVRNGDVLDRLDGTISGLDPQTLTFLVGDQRVPIDRSKPKLFGVVVGRSAADRKAPVGELQFRNGDRLPVSKLSFEGDVLQIAANGVSATTRMAAIEAIDFGRGKVKFLSDLQPRTLEHTPYFGMSAIDSVFDVLKDHSDAGPDVPIRIDRQGFQRGLVIHSRTRLSYRLNGEYQRFVAVAGIEQLVRPLGDLDLIITADDKELFRRNLKGTDSAVPLDLDVTGARELTIFVDFAGDSDISDHLALGDARLIK
ncbi:MAG: NPCBM/NEW2 domain-containing protein [Planctomycetaceae bacterium]